jgi:outer membrane receptor protein involved in Fe transport
MLRVVVLLTLAASPIAAAPASDLADEAQFHFSRGNRQYQAGRIEDALGSYYLSNRLVPNRNVQFNIARCLERLSRFDEAFRAWQTLLDEKLPDNERATVMASIDQLRPNLALVRITTEPAGATIFVNRGDLGSRGTTPKVLALNPGAARLLLEMPGFRSVELPAELIRGQQIEARATLERIYGQLDIRRVPGDAEVRRDLVDGEVLRRGPGLVKAVPGRVVLFVSAPGFQTLRLVAEVAADAITPIDIPLAAAPPSTGSVVVRANVTGALVRVDGKEAGFTPAVIESVAVGRRQVEVVESGRRTFAVDVNVPLGERVFVDAQLTRADPEITAATKTLEAAENTPASITVISAEEIAAFGYQTVAEALAGVRGVFASNDRSYESVGFRGFSPPGDYTNRVLVLMDGHPFNDVMTGGGPVGTDRDLDLANVERIEVVRGPGSVLYGTGALFGVINVVTRRPESGIHGHADGRGGSLGLAQGRASVSARKGDAELLVTAGVLDSGGDRRFAWMPSGTQAAPEVFLGDGTRGYHAELRGRVPTSAQGSLTLHAALNDRTKTFPTGAYDTIAGPASNLHDKRRFAELRFDQTLGSFLFAARAAYDDSWYVGTLHKAADADGITLGEVAHERLDGRWLTGELRLGLPELLRNHITVGAEVQEQLKIQVGEGEGQPLDRVLSGYIVDDWRLADRMRINLGARYSRGDFGHTLSPRVAVVARPYQGGNTKVFVGRAFRSASPYERFNAAAALDPEIAWSGEIEHTHAIIDDLRLTGSVFANRVSGLITIDEQSTYFNIDKPVFAFGAEGELRWEPGGGSLLALSYSRQWVTMDDLFGKVPFPNAPESMATARALAPLIGSHLRVGTEVHVDAGRHTRNVLDRTVASANEVSRVDDAVMWNLSLSGEHRAWRVRYFAGLYNILDVRGYGPGYPSSRDFRFATVPRYGRSLRAGVSLGF